MVAVNYDWDELEDNIDEEYDDAGAAVAEYTTEPEEFGNLVSQRRSGQSSFFHYDGLGSALALTHDSQQVARTYGYTAFGEVLEHFGSTENPFQYVGRWGYYRDEVTVAFLVRRRIFSAAQGRWQSVDPLNGTSVLLSYGYVGNAPATDVDPSGLQAVNCAAKNAACLAANVKRFDSCFTRALIFAAVVCNVRFPNKPKEVCACVLAIVPIYSAACNRDRVEGQVCCAVSFTWCVAKGRWPFWPGRAFGNCPDA